MSETTNENLIYTDSDSDPNFKLEVWYLEETNQYLVKVTDLNTGNSEQDYIYTTYKPLFGIDVSDMRAIAILAEEFAVKLEA